MQYESNNGWIELLLPLLSLKLSRSYTYNLFEAIRDTYIPKGCVKKGNVFHVFRLLILYHDPELCSMLDTKKITPDLYSMDWFQTLFAAKCTFPVVLSMWDLYFQQTDPFLVFFLGLIMLINARDQVLAMKDEPKENILQFLSNMPCALEADDVVDFCSLSQYYSMKTPSSFKTDYLKSLFGSNHEVQLTDCIVSQALCLPVSVYELVENASMELTHQDAVRFFLVDCRPAEQYNVGHLSTAFHLDSNLMLQEPVAFSTAIQGLLRAQKQVTRCDFNFRNSGKKKLAKFSNRQAIEANSNAGGEHLCFMGSGRIEEDQYLYMAVASFLQKNTQYVSLLTGGYGSIHEYFGDHMADCLEDHDPFGCLVCKKDFIGMNAVENDVQLRNKPSSSADAKQQRQSSDLFSKWSAAMKTKSAEVKDKLYEYIVNPSAPNPAANVERHVSSSDKNGRRYRNVAPVFSIDEENDEQAGNDDASQQIEENAKEVVTLQTYLQSADVIASYKCQEVHMNGYMYESHLIVSKTHLVVLRDLDKKGTAQVIVRRPLSSIVKITAKKRHRDLITFK